MYKFIGEEREITNMSLTPNQVKGMMDVDSRIEVVIEVDLYSLLTSGGIDEINDIADNMILEEGCLCDISYEVVGCSDKNTVLILVSA